MLDVYSNLLTYYKYQVVGNNDSDKECQLKGDLTKSETEGPAPTKDKGIQFKTDKSTKSNKPRNSNKIVNTAKENEAFKKMARSSPPSPADLPSFRSPEEYDSDKVSPLLSL